MVTSELRKSLEDYRKLKTKITELQEAVDAIEAAVKEHM